MSRSLKHDFLNMDFSLPNKNGTRIRSIFCKNKKFIYYTSEKSCDPSTFEEIFNHLMPYFDNYVKEYRNYKIQKMPISNSIFRMIIFYAKEQKPMDPRYGKILYETEIDNIHKNKTKYEYKNLNLINNVKEKVISFYVSIEIELFNENSFFIYDGEKDPRIEDVCIVCKKNKSNVLITKCFHLVACDDCLRLHFLYNCPYCDKSFAGIHKVVFTKSKK